MARDTLKITFDLERQLDAELRRVSKDGDRSKRRQVAVMVRRILDAVRQKAEQVNVTDLVR